MCYLGILRFKLLSKGTSLVQVITDVETVETGIVYQLTIIVDDIFIRPHQRPSYKLTVLYLITQ